MPRCLFSPPSRLRSFCVPSRWRKWGPGQGENLVKAFRLQVKTLITYTCIPSFHQDVLQFFIKTTLAQKLLLSTLKSLLPGPFCARTQGVGCRRLAYIELQVRKTPAAPWQKQTNKTKQTENQQHTATTKTNLSSFPPTKSSQIKGHMQTSPLWRHWTIFRKVF